MNENCPKKIDQSDVATNVAGITPEHLQKMREGRDRNRRFGFSNPLIHQIKKLKIINWLYMFEKSTISILEAVSESTRFGVVRKLIKNGYLIESKINLSSCGDGATSYITLSEQALRDIEDFRASKSHDPLFKYESIAPGLSTRYRQYRKFGHDFLVQRITLREISKIERFYPEQLYIKHEKEVLFGKKVTDKKSIHVEIIAGKKYPDAIWIYNSKLSGQKRIAIEVEKNSKYSKELMQFVGKIIRELEPNKKIFTLPNGLSNEYDEFRIYVSGDAEYRYKKAFSAGAKCLVRREIRNSDSTIEVEEVIELVPDWVQSKVIIVWDPYINAENSKLFRGAIDKSHDLLSVPLVKTLIEKFSPEEVTRLVQRPDFLKSLENLAAEKLSNEEK